MGFWVILYDYTTFVGYRYERLSRPHFLSFTSGKYFDHYTGHFHHVDISLHMSCCILTEFLCGSRRRIKLGFTGLSERYLTRVRVKLRFNKFQFEYIYCIIVFQIFNLNIKIFKIMTNLHYLNKRVSFVMAQPILIIQLI